MTDINASDISGSAPNEAGFGDYVALLKPRVMSLVVFTAFVGLVVARFCVRGVSAGVDFSRGDLGQFGGDGAVYFFACDG